MQTYVLQVAPWLGLELNSATGSGVWHVSMFEMSPLPSLSLLEMLALHRWHYTDMQAGE